MERWQSTWENSVDYNLSESGVQPIPLRELLRDEAATERFLDHPLAYSQGNGTPELRSEIADLYRGATPNHVLVTTGSSEANLLAMWHLVEPADEIVVILPNYMENWGLVQALGGNERTLIVNGLSKAYGLPGLRIGWIVGPPETVATLWGYHDYTTLAPTYLSDRLAQIALAPVRREEILARTRSILQRNYTILADWIRDHGSLFSYIPPTAGAICFLRYALRINSSDLAWRLLKEKSTLIVPGDHFEMDGYIRIGMGDAPAYLTQGLERIDALLRELRAEKGKA